MTACLTTQVMKKKKVLVKKCKSTSSGSGSEGQRYPKPVVLCPVSDLGGSDLFLGTRQDWGGRTLL